MKNKSRLCLLIESERLKKENEAFRRFLEITISDKDTPERIREQAEILITEEIEMDDKKENNMSEADYIRSLTDEELADYLWKIEKSIWQCMHDVPDIERLKIWYRGFIEHPHGEDF